MQKEDHNKTQKSRCTGRDSLPTYPEYVSNVSD